MHLEDYQHTIKKDGKFYSGVHYLIELRGSPHLNNLNLVEDTLLECVNKCNINLLSKSFHEFPNGAITGTLLLSESHMSIHTWPEYKYAAIDIFTCGDSDPSLCIPVLVKMLECSNMSFKVEWRGPIF